LTKDLTLDFTQSKISKVNLEEPGEAEASQKEKASEGSPELKVQKRLTKYIV
jgi:hypothetical protein